MRFIDEVEITVKAGNGGRGCVSFRREKFVPKGGPDGGDGGKGGDLVFVTDSRISSLIDLRYKRRYEAKNGQHGMGSNCYGKKGEDLLIRVPPGTIIKDAATEVVIKDLVIDGEDFILRSGGRGGKGNAHFVSSTHQAPRYAQPGEEGEELLVRLELKLLADVAIIGFPNAGKSTLISHVSAAKPKIADYPFTTLVPNLGVVKFGDFGGYVMADIPGLIEGAHTGKGLGIRFLKHIERTRLLIHLLDLSPDTARDPLEDFALVNEELRRFNPELADRPMVVALNKVDITEADEKAEELLKFFTGKGIKVFRVSAVTGAGLKGLIDYVGTELVRLRDEA
jgi:GTP-binding protein